MNKLVKETIRKYQKSLKNDSNNEDAIYFIMEEIGNREGMNEIEFNEYCDMVWKELESL